MEKIYILITCILPEVQYSLQKKMFCSFKSNRHHTLLINRKLRRNQSSGSRVITKEISERTEKQGYGILQT